MSSTLFLTAAYLLNSLVTQPSLSENKTLQNSEPSQPVFLQKYGGSDPHGPDPHGDDPHDEQHDSGMPANREQKDQKAPKDVYGGQYPNGQAPY